MNTYKLLLLALALIGLTLSLVQTNDRLKELESRVPDIPYKICSNFTYEDSSPIIKQIACPCAKDGCLMYCGNVTGYRLENKTITVCEPQY